MDYYPFTKDSCHPQPRGRTWGHRAREESFDFSGLSVFSSDWWKTRFVLSFDPAAALHSVKEPSPKDRGPSPVAPGTPSAPPSPPQAQVPAERGRLTLGTHPPTWLCWVLCPHPPLLALVGEEGRSGNLPFLLLSVTARAADLAGNRCPVKVRCSVCAEIRPVPGRASLSSDLWSSLPLPAGLRGPQDRWKTREQHLAQHTQEDGQGSQNKPKRNKNLKHTHTEKLQLR